MTIGREVKRVCPSLKAPIHATMDPRTFHSSSYFISLFYSVILFIFYSVSRTSCARKKKKKKNIYIRVSIDKRELFVSLVASVEANVKTCERNLRNVFIFVRFLRLRRSSTRERLLNADHRASGRYICECKYIYWWEEKGTSQNPQWA